MARPDADGNITCTGCKRSLPGTVRYFHRHRDAFKPRCKECRGSSFGVHDLNKVLDTPEGKKICTGCKQLLPADSDHFFTSEKTSDGFLSQCKKCSDDVNYGVHRPNRVLDVPEGYWYCSSCEQTLPLNDRHFASAGDGFSVYCRPCSNLLTNERRRAVDDEAEISGREWRFIRAMWLDGGIVQCAYCGTGTETPERDHVQPLSNGGETVPENIVPACQGCNLSKGHSPVTEWYPDSDVFSPERWEKIQAHVAGDSNIPS